MSQPAVSKQISLLENELKLALFDRTANRSRLTANGRRLHEVTNRTFDDMEEFLNQLRAGVDVLTVAAQSAVVESWFAPRLPELRAAMEPTRLQLTIFDRDDELDLLDHDVSIRFGRRPPSRLRSRMWLPESVRPAAAPELAAELGLDQDTPPQRLWELERVGKVQFLEFDQTDRNWLNWSSWLETEGLTWDLPGDAVLYRTHGSAMAQAVSGAGIALAWDGLSRELFRRSLLVPVGPSVQTSGAGYRLVWPAALSRDEGFRRFTDWLDALIERP